MSPGLGFLDLATAAGISSITATVATAGIQIYGTYKQLELAEEAADLQNQLALKRFELEAQLAETQKRILDIQASGLEQRQNIDLEIARVQADFLMEQLEILRKEQELQAQINQTRMSRELLQETQLFIPEIVETSEIAQAATRALASPTNISPVDRGILDAASSEKSTSTGGTVASVLVGGIIILAILGMKK